MAVLLSAPTKNAVQKTLGAELLSSATTGGSITLSDTDGIPNLPGVLVIDRVDSNGTATPSKREYIEYSGTSGSNVIITTRNVDSGGTTQTHAVGAIVEFVPDVIWADRIYDALGNIIDVTTLAVDTTKIVTPTGTQTLTNKTLTTPIISTISNTGTVTLPTATDTLVGRATTDTLTNKRITPRVITTTDDATAVIDVDVTDQYQLTAMANATTFTVTGTPTAGQKLIVRLKDNGTARALTWTGFTSKGATLPTTTVLSKTHYIGLIYNATDTTWDCVAATVEV